MHRSTIAVLWILSVVIAAAAGWFTGLTNATRVAADLSHVMVNLILILLVIALASAAWLFLRPGHHSERKVS